MNESLATNVRTPEEVSADIEKLKREQVTIADQIFTLEQSSMDYQAVLNNPQFGADRLTELANLRERLRSVDIALLSAKQALGDSEAHQKRMQLAVARLKVKTALEQRNEAARESAQALDMLADSLRKLKGCSIEVLRTMNFSAEGVLTDKGWMILGGSRVLNDTDLLQNWVNMALARRLGPMWPHDRVPTFGIPPDITEPVEESGQNTMREWDAANRSYDLKVIDHDPLESAEPVKG